MLYANFGQEITILNSVCRERCARVHAVSLEYLLLSLLEATLLSRALIVRLEILCSLSLLSHLQYTRTIICPRPIILHVRLIICATPIILYIQSFAHDRLFYTHNYSSRIDQPAVKTKCSRVRIAQYWGSAMHAFNVKFYSCKTFSASFLNDKIMLWSTSNDTVHAARGRTT